MAYQDMTCEQLIRSLADDLAGDLPADEHERISRHLATCEDCAAYRRNYEAIVRENRAVGSETPGAMPDDLARLILSSRHRPQ